ncbi:MAG: hypothetical protein R3C58_00230 [Parvularculaceae bacterium]
MRERSGRCGASVFAAGAGAFLTQYDGEAACEAEVNAPKPEYIRESGDNRPVPVTYCAPAFPKLLQQAGYEADCRVRFSVAEAGAAQVHSAECYVWGMEAKGPEWIAFAKAAFEGVARRAFARTVFQQASPQPDVVYVQPLKFLFGD